MAIADQAETVSPDRLPDRGSRSVTPYRDPVVRLAALVQRYDSRIPARDLLAASDYGLARSMVSPYGSYAEVASALHLSPRAIVPFALLLALSTLYWNMIEGYFDLLAAKRLFAFFSGGLATGAACGRACRWRSAASAGAPKPARPLPPLPRPACPPRRPR